jgi:hypothetical protein
MSQLIIDLPTETEKKSVMTDVSSALLSEERRDGNLVKREVHSGIKITQFSREIEMNKLQLRKASKSQVKSR